MKGGRKRAGRNRAKAKGQAQRAPPAAVPTMPDWMDAKWWAQRKREAKAREREARKAGMTVAELNAIQEAWQKGHELKKLQAKYGDPDRAEQNCLELLDLVPRDNGVEGWTPDGLMNVSAQAAEQLLEMATSPQRDERGRERARANLCCLIEVIGRDAFAAFRHADKTQPNIAAQYLTDGLVTCCVLFREAIQEGSERFKPWTRKRFFLPSLRAYTDAFDDDFGVTKTETKLATGTGVNLRGKPRLEGATLEVAEALQMTRWPPTPNAGKEWQELTRDKASLSVWWRNRIEPWLLLNRERLLKSRRFANIVKNPKFKSDNARWTAVSAACKQALKTLATPHPIRSP